MSLTRLAQILAYAGLACMGLTVVTFVMLVLLKPSWAAPLSGGIAIAGILLRLAAYGILGIERSNERSDRADPP